MCLLNLELENHQQLLPQKARDNPSISQVACSMGRENLTSLTVLPRGLEMKLASKALVPGVLPGSGAKPDQEQVKMVRKYVIAIDGEM